MNDVGNAETKKPINNAKLLMGFLFLAPRPRLEPGTYGLTAKKNQRMLHGINLQLLDITAFFLSGIESI
jgi:hypothetical protein